MSDRRLDQLRRQLAAANTVAAFKALHDDAAALAKEAATARDFSFLDDCTAVRLACMRNGGVLMLGGAERVPGIDADAAEQWCKRARLDESEFTAVVSKVQTMQRRRAGESPPRKAQGRGAEPQAKTLLSPWRVDELGNRTRYVVGVCARLFKERTRSGGDPDKVEAELLAEVLRRAA
jgi:hypothetical protein